MIPLILADPATGTGKPVPRTDAKADDVKATSFGDLMTDAEVVADDLPLPTREEVDIILSENEAEVAPISSDTKKAETEVKLLVSLTSDVSQPPKANAKDMPVDGRQVPSGMPASPSSLDADTAVDAKMALQAKGDKADAPLVESKAQRPSVAQSVVEGKLPQTSIPDKPVPNSASARMAPAADLDIPTPPVAMPTSTADKPAQPAKDGLAKVAVGVFADETPRMRREETVATAIPAIKPTAPALTTGPPPAVALAQMTAQLQQDISEKGVKANLGEGNITSTPIERQTMIPTTQAVPAATATPETARHVASQIAVAVANTPGKATEIALNPEELGRVRLSLSAADGAIVLNVLAERPETQDLLRRHMDLLAQEFRDLGYTSISFTFGDQKSEARSDEAPRDEPAELDVSEAADTPAILTAPQTTGLDLRI
ncbi:flagellar hook-length control protein FliK [Roseobacter sp. CCS2]|uniref:flagellar hook-length control protein FliK n=1 Tax=Roseobacter sp. CCS2 TaxID=391593 RepID=UPI0000F40000|nr:flagellar hook-length control protein FliK [Roseobacter sp. CCS2]EBA13823.1 flagellar hook-length control protein [Roseobacter sp. CCS2]